MKSHQFRLNHLSRLLEAYEKQHGPIDYFVSCYFRENKALGSKDRAFIAEEVYRIIRWKALIDYFVPDSDWQKKLEWISSNDPKSFLQDEKIPLHIRYSLPKALLDELTDSWGEEKAKEIALNSLEKAPTVIRTNLLKTTRDVLLKRFLSQDFVVSATEHSPAGIEFHKKMNFFTLKEFTDGLFEVQDEGSQLVADLVDAHPFDHVLDFCAGAGGKTLGFAHRLEGRGQIYLHDIRLHALHEARKRLKRAGIQNAQILPASDEQKLKKLKKTMDWVLVDAPCTGCGTLRRNPDMKWKFTTEMVDRIVSTQRVIFEQALSYVKPGGHIVYATCSILKKENDMQVEHFLKHYPIELVREPFSSLPEPGKMDGFFGATFKKIK